MAEEKKKEQGEEASKKCKKVVCPPEGAPAWLVTFSDLVTLLLTFFVLLQSMSTTNKVNFTTAAASIRTALTGKDPSSQIEFVLPVFPKQPKVEFAPITAPSVEKIYEKIKSQIDTRRIQDSVGLQKSEDGALVLRINDSVLFEPGKAQIAPQSYPILRNIADIIRPLPMDVRIEGHTDDTPLPGIVDGNWDLSVARSVSVLRFFKESDLLPLDRMGAVGYGKDRPVMRNIDDATRAVNRRVDFVLRLNKPTTGDTKSRGREDGAPL
jgi:chemotaxis protein MotB